LYDCLICISEYIVARDAFEEMQKKEGTSLPADAVRPVYGEVVSPAITLAPMWQEKYIGNQMVLQCVTVPCCLRHIGKQPETTIEKIAKSGLAVPGMS